MNTIMQGDGDFADDIVEQPTYEASMPTDKDFLPWHRPRKQFVRDKQWREQIGRLLDDAPRTDETIKYLGLPGVDLIDLRYFHAELCATRDLKLRFLGFNTALASANTQTELNISLDEVRRLDGVDPRSDIIADDFVRVANMDSIAWRRARDLAPFDVLNLDLCNGFAFQEAGRFDENNYNAMAQLLTLQSRHNQPWLLLLTTLAGAEHVEADVLRKLLEKYIGNLETCIPFRDASVGRFAIGDAAEARAAVATEEGLLSVFLCGLGKWLASLSLAQAPPTKIEVKSVIGYRVQGDHGIEDLISIAIRFTPTFLPVADPLGLAANVQEAPCECTTAVQVLNRVAARRNADAILSADTTLKKAMAADTADLLRRARYSVEKYAQWLVDSGEADTTEDVVRTAT